MEINHNNIHQVIRYINAMRALNRFCKDSFNKWQKETLSIYPILSVIHIEVDELEKKVNKYLNIATVQNEYIKKDKYYYGKILSFSSDRNSYIHITSGVTGKKFSYEKITIGQDNRMNYMVIDCSEKLVNESSPVDMSTCRDFIWKIIDGTIKEISKEEYDAAYDKLIKVKNIIYEND